MSSNSSPLQDSWQWCFDNLPNAGKTNSYYTVNLATSVVLALLAPMTVTGNAIILATIWKNSSLRTPSYVLLAGLAVTDFFTGLLSQPVYILNNWSDITGNRKINCITTAVAMGQGFYFSSLAGLVIMMTAVERWLHMNRRSLLTVRRVVILYIAASLLLIPMVVGISQSWLLRKAFFNKLMSCYVLGAALCVAFTAFAYFKVFQIIRHHQKQVQTNESAIDMRKFRKSLFTILFILAVFVLSYLPYLCWQFAVIILQNSGNSSMELVKDVCVVLVFLSSLLNPLLYYWRVKEIRDDVKSNLRKLFCPKNAVGSLSFPPLSASTTQTTRA